MKTEKYRENVLKCATCVDNTAIHLLHEFCTALHYWLNVFCETEGGLYSMFWCKKGRKNKSVTSLAAENYLTAAEVPVTPPSPQLCSTQGF